MKQNENIRSEKSTVSEKQDYRNDEKKTTMGRISRISESATKKQ
ncbi:hypothetical protein [Staphylococcus agnetis]|nr:hypothetical protein [Staphylococcus agnetis]